MTQKKEYSIEELETKYNDITALYDLSEQLVDTVESDLVKNPGEQLDLLEPLINEIGDASDVLTEEFIMIAESTKRKAPNRASKSRIEGALRRIYAAIGDYQLRVQAAGKQVKNIADPIVEKIQRALEQIVVIFLEFMQISLQSIMGKAELEALRVRDARIALMMHQQALSQQQ